MSNIKTNVPQVALEDYHFLIAGVPKGGKTSLFANLIQEYYGEINSGLLLAFEKGYKALKVNAVDINDWGDFEDVVDQLIDNKDSLPYKVIGLDTTDIMWDYAQDATIREWNIANPSKRTKDIGGVGAKGKSDSGYGVGYNIAKTKIKTNIDKLSKAGYGIISIAHSKDKAIEEKSGLKYDQLVVSLPQSAREVFVNLADFICFVTVEKERDEDNTLTTKRYIYFRTDGYVEAGSRFRNVPERVEYGVTEFLDVFRNAIITEFDEGTDIVKVEKEQKKQKQKEVKEYLAKNKKGIEDIVKEIKVLCKEKSAQGAKVSEINEIIGTLNYETVDEAQSVLDSLNNL